MDLGNIVWRKSTKSDGNNDCVEVADLPHGVGVRDSKDPHGPALTFTPGEWATFAASIKDHSIEL